MKLDDETWLRILALESAGKGRKAFPMLLEGAKRGDADAQNSLASWYAGGIGVRRNATKAREWYLRSWRGGHVCAGYNLGMLFLDQRNVRRARVWFKRAMLKGDGDSAVKLVETYIQSIHHRTDLRPRLKSILKRALRADQMMGESRDIAIELLGKI